MKKIILFISLVVLLTSCQVLPTPQPTITPTSALAPLAPTAIAKPLNKYHDPILGFSLNYPNTWREIGIRRLKGDDSYLTISELPDYHSLSANQVCSGYVYKNLKGKVFSLAQFGFPGCVILQIPYTEKPKSGDKMLGIFRRYNPETYEYDYFLLESTYPDFIEITSSLVFDKDLAVPDTSILPHPKPFQLDLNGLHISETFMKAANFNGEDWNIQNLSVSDKNRDYTRTTQCGKSITVDSRTLVASQLHNQNTGADLIEVRQDENVIFSIDIFPTPSASIWVFCEWNSNWFLETSDFIIQNGEILNHKLGYDEMFGWQILAGKPFYFFTKDGIVHISHDGKVLPTEYNFVPHYGCCETGTIRNPHGNDNEVWFFGARDGAWYYVEINTN